MEVYDYMNKRINDDDFVFVMTFEKPTVVNDQYKKITSTYAALQESLTDLLQDKDKDYLVKTEIYYGDEWKEKHR